jgi:hypothetical protein|nr:ferritin-like domain-containing protein [Kofleriaceae bacterium]
MTTTQLSAILAQALLAACGSSQAPPPPPHTVDPLSNTAGSGSAATATPPPAKACHHTKAEITGCGGGEVKFPQGTDGCDLGSGNDPALPAAQCAELCAGIEIAGCHAFMATDGPEVFCESAHPCMGRLASAGELGRGAYADGAIAHLALARRMEAHSVHAFDELAADLARFGAPAPLIEACRRAAADEAGHADAIAALLRARGVALEELPASRAGGFGSLRELALHNEREGVVGETWGALVGRYQAEHAVDADVRAAMATIADDETAHAALSMAIAAWARDVLPAADAHALADARAAAIVALRDGADARPAGDAADRLGWPGEQLACALLDQLAPALVTA